MKRTCANVLRREVTDRPAKRYASDEPPGGVRKSHIHDRGVKGWVDSDSAAEMTVEWMSRGAATSEERACYVAACALFQTFRKRESRGTCIQELTRVKMIGRCNALVAQ